MMRLCLPCRAIRQIGHQLPPAASADGPHISRAEVVVTLADPPITAGELRGLRVGDIVATETEGRRSGDRVD